MSEADPELYGLGDPDLLQEAMTLAPELFAALRLANRLGPERYPITSDDNLEDLLTSVANDGSNFVSRGIIIARDDTDRFPDGFLPITDSRDLVRKVYMAIIIDHQAKGEAQLANIRNGTIQLDVSHPLPEGLI